MSSCPDGHADHDNLEDDDSRADLSCRLGSVVLVEHVGRLPSSGSCNWYSVRRFSLQIGTVPSQFGGRSNLPNSSVIVQPNLECVCGCLVGLTAELEWFEAAGLKEWCVFVVLLFVVEVAAVEATRFGLG